MNKLQGFNVIVLLMLSFAGLNTAQARHPAFSSSDIIIDSLQGTLIHEDGYRIKWQKQRV